VGSVCSKHDFLGWHVRAFCCSFQHSPEKKILYRGKDKRAQSAGCEIEKSKVQVARLTTGCDDLRAKMKRQERSKVYAEVQEANQKLEQKNAKKSVRGVQDGFSLL
jgi:hypothetical protein